MKGATGRADRSTLNGARTEGHDMPDNDSGNGNGGEGAAITYQEARQALGPPRDRLDLVALFAADQADALRRAIEAQADSMQGLFALVQQRFALIEAEIERMKAERERDRADMGGADDGGRLQ
jgi:uncharacterized small protein (DUF1192 family)